jgi:ribosome-binding factor A
MASRRVERVAETIRMRLIELFTRELDDPRLRSVIVTSVRLSSDLTHARVLFRTLEAEDDATNRRLSRLLKSATPRLRGALGQRLALPRVPEIVFEYDRGPDHRDRVEELLLEIAREPKSSEPD